MHGKPKLMHTLVMALMTHNLGQMHIRLPKFDQAIMVFPEHLDEVGIHFLAQLLLNIASAPYEGCALLSRFILGLAMLKHKALHFHLLKPMLARLDISGSH